MLSCDTSNKYPPVSQLPSSNASCLSMSHASQWVMSLKESCLSMSQVRRTWMTCIPSMSNDWSHVSQWVMSLNESNESCQTHMDDLHTLHVKGLESNDLSHVSQFDLTGVKCLESDDLSRMTWVIPSMSNESKDLSHVSQFDFTWVRRLESNDLSHTLHVKWVEWLESNDLSQMTSVKRLEWNDLSRQREIWTERTSEREQREVESVCRRTWVKRLESKDLSRMTCISVCNLDIWYIIMDCCHLTYHTRTERDNGVYWKTNGKINNDVIWHITQEHSISNVSNTLQHTSAIHCHLTYHTWTLYIQSILYPMTTSLTFEYMHQVKVTSRTTSCPVTTASPGKRYVCVAACCSVLPCVAVCCSVTRATSCLVTTASLGNGYVCIAVCCNVLQRVAVCMGARTSSCHGTTG